jgi:hypothetical protein
MRIIQRLLCGIWQPGGMEILKPTVVTKASLVVSILFILKYKDLIDAPIEIVYFGVVVYFTFIRLLSLLFGVDPFVPFENLVCCIFFGGLMDSLKRRMTKVDTTATTNKNNPAAHKTKDE